MLELIDKLDECETIRDKVAAILAAEIAGQKAQAIDADKDPALWDLRIYTERSTAWEMFLHDTDAGPPVVNIWIDGMDFTGRGSDVVGRQKTETAINIDVFASMPSTEAGAGHLPGDEASARAVQRACRLIRNILMADTYTYLGLRGQVWKRWIESTKYFQPTFQGVTVQHVVGARITLQVTHNELSPQFTGEIMEAIDAQVLRKADGALYAAATFEYEE
jgi:hypothetical protein